ncbi:hypothetical protein FA95DRAFT_141390 [Auriscalpium vulgare]|uniref:Uncharacterized protein n=1 Tax=Auriscalpium vulgare TaxID=40419 RepID=A0ACB8S6W1_9AGAM|nr:hypothetical protein FA95DRAFT_141390 [Auriscalpium vulgare]
MNDGRHTATAQSPYPPAQWSRSIPSQGYPVAQPPQEYPTSSYGSPHLQSSHGSAYPVAYAYGQNGQGAPAQSGYPSAARLPPYSPPSGHPSHPSASQYPSQNGYVQVGDSARQAYSHSRAYSLPQPYGSPPQSSNPYGSQSPTHSSMPMHGGDQVQYPASPQRPFACDMCALSFNRQHDLKRHRETHSGEKPFLCNGPCGKTFTRKDALKRHQLVKRCGYEEPS